MLSEHTVVGKIEVLEDGQIHVRVDTVVERDGVELTRQFHRHVEAPRAAIDSVQDARVRAIAAVVWTPDVVARYEQQQQALAARFTEGT